jgi:integrase
MISRRNSPDGLPFRLYARAGKFKVSFGYKRPDGKWEFRLSAPTRDKEAVAKAKAEAVERANILNGAAVPDGETAAIFQRYFRWQRDLPRNSQDRKADNTLKENQYEAKRLLRTFGKVKPSVIKPMHVYKYLAARAKEGAPAKANKEIALLSAVLEFGRREGALETNPCRGIKYNKTLPSTKVVSQAEIDFAVRVARERGGAYIVIALCLVTAYLMVNRPDEVRHMRRADIDWDKGIRVAIGKRKGGEAQRYKMISWSPSLLATIKEALSLQRTTSMYVFGNSSGQPYTVSGFNTNLRRLMAHCIRRAKEEEIPFSRFTLANMRPSAVTDRLDAGDSYIVDATGHTDRRMVDKTYDRRRLKVAKATK